MPSLNPQQLQAARLIYGLAVGRGLSPEQAREVVAASYAESGLNPNATNKSSGAAGLFQLLSPGYRQSAQSLGGLYNPRANALAILPSYASFFASHPNAAPGEAGAAVERSGQGAGFYASPLSLLAGLGGGAGARQAPMPPEPATMPQAPQMPNPGLALGLIKSLQATENGAPLQLGFLNGLQAEQSATAAPTRNAGQRTHSSKTPIDYTRIVGYPYQGTHAKQFNAQGGSDNWQSENAVDLAAPVGTPVYAAFSGTIGDNIGSQGQGGRFAGMRVQVNGGSNAAWYGHLSKIVVKAGQAVKAGQLLGYSGEANGVAHLHFAVQSGNPLSYVR